MWQPGKTSVWSAACTQRHIHLGMQPPRCQLTHLLPAPWPLPCLQRSPDAPADPAELASNRGSDPDRVLRTAAAQADQAMARGYSDRAGPDTGGSHLAQAPAMAGRLAEKVAGAAGIAAQAASGAVSAMSQTVQAASGAAAGISHEHGSAPHHFSEGRDASPVSDDVTVGELERGGADSSGLEWGQQVAETNADTAKQGEVDTASGTATDESVRLKAEQGGYTQAANRLMDIEGLPRKDDSGVSSGKA
ncbi:hypothetical protein COO60DRAFT_1492785 [Scenedesmus sp. NREL 46B-D3]|nr:hypothetical protein COO60DRAFT_1492785 [Scenedesmus sp. NREL 46B-D3]